MLSEQMREETISALWPLLLDKLDTGVAVTDPQGRVIFVNHAFLDAFEIESNEILGAPVTKATMRMVDEERRHLTPLSLPVMRTLKTGMPIRAREYHFESPTRGWLTWIASATPLLGKGGRVEAVILTMNDVTAFKRTMLALEITEKRFREIAEHSRDFIAYEDLDGIFQYVSPASKLILGYEPTEMIGRASEEFVHKDEVEELRRRHADLNQEYFHTVFRARHKDGSYRWLDTNCTIVRDSEHQPQTFLVICRDITERRAAAETIRRSEAELALAQEIAHLGSFEISYPDGALYWSRELHRICGTNPDDYRPTDGALFEFIHPDDRDRVRCAMESARARHESYELQHRIVCGNGAERWVLERGRYTFDEAGNAVRLNGAVLDITEQKLAEERAAFLDTHDSLTGLPNRQVFAEYVSQAIRIAQKSAGRLAVFCIDPDRFKAVNDSLGHSAGDTLLKSMAERITGSIGAGEFASRLGGAAFLVCAECESVEDVVTLATRLHSALAAPYQIGEQPLEMTTTIGISMYPSDGTAADDLISSAEGAMYRAKAAGCNTIELATRELQHAARLRLGLEQDLRTAIRDRRFVLHYQPIVNLTTGRIAGCEALLRWEHPRRGLLAPAAFINEAEETGLIVPIGEWVLETSCASIAQWTERFSGDLFITVNISARQLKHGGLPEKIAACFGRYKGGAEKLVVELVESTVMDDPDLALRLLREIRDMGVRIAVDDFGIGYSSLAYLKRFPLNTVKIDRTFVGDLETDENDAAIAQSIVTLAHSLGLQVVAEGAETARQLQMLREFGCDFVQGYYFSRPVPADDFEAMLAGGKRLQQP
ncbi:MAG TPA: EAL domain-containing protein [Candidatus Baltobacteraceae bacterium]|nr:EAL domain-containing protein [Candidatus Baltobacteraceae bacterium]